MSNYSSLGGVNTFNTNMGMVDIQQLQTLQMMQNIQSYQNIPQNYSNNMQTNSLLQNIYNNPQVLNSIGLNGQVLNANINNMGNNLGTNYSSNFNSNLNTMNNYNPNLNNLNVSNYNTNLMNNFPAHNNFNTPTGFNPQKLNTSDNLPNMNFNPNIYYNSNQNHNSITNPNQYLTNNINQNNSKILEALINSQQNNMNNNNMNPNNINFNSSQFNVVSKVENDFLNKRFRDESFNNLKPPGNTMLGFEPNSTNLKECESNKESLGDKYQDIKESCKEE
jgi:hypothetical protein